MRASARRVRSRRRPLWATTSSRRRCSSGESILGGSGTRMNMIPMFAFVWRESKQMVQATDPEVIDPPSAPRYCSNAGEFPPSRR
jgi:hypothetical protein